MDPDHQHGTGGDVGGPVPLRDLSRPTTPSRALGERMREETVERGRRMAPAPELSAQGGAPAEWRDRLEQLVEDLRPAIVELSHDIHDHPELGFSEHHAMAAVAGLLDRWDIAHDDGVFGVDTALRAEVGPGSGAQGTPWSSDTADERRPAVGILCEYDALPGIGHGCGHNVMAAQSVGAFLALALLERELAASRAGGVPGRVVLQTTPAEEAATCKEILAQAGAFEGLDAAVMAHSSGEDVTHQTWLGVRRFRVVFHGVAAHASAAPHMGRNALDAATLALTGLGLLRQHIGTMDRMHAIVSDGGTVPNIVPERSEVTIYVRSKYPETLLDLVSRVTDVFRGAALMTGTGVEFVWDTVTNEMPLRSNGPLLESWVRAERRRGRDPLPAGVIPESNAAGTDFGNVSLRIPGIHPLVSVGDPTLSLHTREMAEAAGSPTGDEAAVDGAFGLASVVLDVLADADLRARMREDFESAGGAVDVAHFYDRA